MLADRILFIDGEAIVVDKPAGLPVDPPRDESLSVASHGDSLAFGFRRPPTAVHRLDRNTSGCLLLSRNPKAHARFAQAFETRGVDKVYWAVVSGVPDADEGMIDAPLHKVSSEAAGWRMIVDARGKSARTAWRTLEVRDGRALIELRPETGRTHQLRVHAVHGLGLSIVGDPLYGVASPDQRRVPMMLHARSLHVDRGAKSPVEATAPVPPHFLAAGFAAEIEPGPAYIPGERDDA